jgi:hypothetical protein
VRTSGRGLTPREPAIRAPCERAPQDLRGRLDARARRKAARDLLRCDPGAFTMNETIWAVPRQRIAADTARRNILLQHQRIRALLEHARNVAESALDEETVPPDAVASAIGDIHATFEVHMRFEEKVLVDIFNDDLPLGPQRAARLLDEHGKQRATLESLHEEAKRGPRVPMLAAKLAFLASWLLDDMAEEERTLLTPEVVRDDLIAVDQSDG